jgi:4-hydroxy-tetrahydrodipicolinate synthase
MTPTHLPTGLWPVMLTTFHEDGAIDWTGINLLTDWYIANGATGLFTCCLSSEMYHLDEEERLDLARHVVKRARGLVPVVATGTFGGPLSQQAEFIRRMADSGVAAVVVTPNQLATADEDERRLQARMEELLRATEPIPLGLYEAPSPYKRLLSAQLTRWLATSERFLYLKDTTGDPKAIRAKVAATQGTPLQIYNANAQSALQSLSDDAAGLSPIAANCYPELFTWLCNHYHYQAAEADDLQRLLRLMEAVVSLQYPASAKLFLQLRGLPIRHRCRSMMLQITYDLQSMLDSLLNTVEQLRFQLEIE